MGHSKLWARPLVCWASCPCHQHTALTNEVVLGSWTNISGGTFDTVPSHGLAYRLLQRRRLLAERLFKLGVIYHERFLELVEHLDHLAASRVEKTYSPHQDLRCCLDACRLANFLKDQLHELARCERLGAG